jgi:hypothetical protein
MSGGRVSPPEVGHRSCPASILLRFSLACSPAGGSIDICNCRSIQVLSIYGDNNTKKIADFRKMEAERELQQQNKQQETTIGSPNGMQNIAVQSYGAE